MTQVDLIKILQQQARDFKKRVFTLREIAILSHLSLPAAGMLLLRAAKKGVVSRAGGLWINLMDPPTLEEVGFSLSPVSYLSFESALYHHGVISQSPRGGLSLATAGRPRRVDTALGSIRFIHLKSPLFFGFDARRIASPEKAWLDLLYIRGRQGRRDLVMEEIYFERLNKKRVANWAKKFPPWVGVWSVFKLTEGRFE